MSRLHDMKSKGLDKVTSVYNPDKTMQEVVDEKSTVNVSTRDNRSKTKTKTLKATMKV